MEIRPARPEDYDAVAAFTRDTWADRGGSDYIPDIYHDWISPGELAQATLLVDTGEETPSDDVAAIAQVVMLSEYEGWAQGMRVAPDYREQGLATRLSHALLDWARERGARRVRNMVYSWNVPSLANARTVGFDPGIEFRWATPDPDATADPAAAIRDDADAAWTYWTGSEARTALSGLALDPVETWALSELTRDRLHDAAADDRLFVVGDDRATGFTYRNRTYSRERDDEGEGEETWAEYAVAAWDDASACESLLDAIRRDAASVGADRTRVLFPERIDWITDAALARSDLAEEPTFVMEADLS
ncbi:MULTISPECIES: GNAT family N-acetyltransferase [unclassified Haloferax]|uniref:GNAT family N-acetyltransferase n=1 Tax=unclassified Haloferax TaxID=2625095 RepID=UPI000E26C7E5|nr:MULTISPECIES: GNAT family N-acetyltransferase [unclassified Haloferax]RDZ34863.1 GNAT family N-acetyltransferase [Haloferax sp. Atlit-24N]RLM35274.1 GNAT family N-acetyltransferase [Haloferax sp. Atlit-109R]RLM43123.1 GNAT family N-acetyltransferase [Haloferax sp. Atlit-105R]